jgi:hypothetical protein
MYSDHYEYADSAISEAAAVRDEDCAISHSMRLNNGDENRCKEVKS